MSPKLILIVVLLGTLQAEEAQGQVTNWPQPVHLGPTGGSVGKIVPAPNQPERFYLIGDSRVFRSPDAGNTWQDITPPELKLPVEFNPPEDFDIHVSSLDSDRLTLTGTRESYYRSDDGGDNWILEQTQAQSYGDFYTSYADPDGSGIVLAFMHGFEIHSLMRSWDGGATWSDPFEEFEHPSYSRLWINPFNASVMVAGEQELFVSVDGGHNWRAMAEGFGYSQEVSFDPNDPLTLYVHSHDTTWKTTNFGFEWVQLSNSSDGYGFTSFAVEPGQSDNLYGVSETYSNLLFHSSDGGLTWEEHTSFATLERVQNVVFPSDDSERVFVSLSPGGIFQLGGGGAWSSRNVGLNRTGIESIAVISPETLVVHVPRRGLLKSVNGGDSWDAVENISTSDISSLHQTTGNPSTLLVTRPHHRMPFRSTDIAITWEEVEAPYDSISAIDATDDGSVIYVATFSDVEHADIALTTDAGRNWRLSNINDSSYSGKSVYSVSEIIINPMDSQIVYARVRLLETRTPLTDAVLRSQDGGISWVLIAADTDDFFLNRVDPNRLYYWRRIYLSYNESIWNYYISSDGGSSWSEMFMPPETERVYDLVASPLNSDFLFASVEPGRIVTSRDNGASWETIADSLSSGYRDLAFAPGGSSVLFAGTGHDGLVSFDLSGIIPTGLTDPHTRSDVARQLFVYPNPARSSVQITIPGGRGGRVGNVEVFDIMGRRIAFSLQHEAGETFGFVRIQTIDWPRGVYFVRLVNGQTVHHGKFIKY